MSPPSTTILHASLILRDSFLRHFWHLVSRPPFELGNLWGNCRFVQCVFFLFLPGRTRNVRWCFFAPAKLNGPKGEFRTMVLIFLSYLKRSYRLVFWVAAIAVDRGGTAWKNMKSRGKRMRIYVSRLESQLNNYFVAKKNIAKTLVSATVLDARKPLELDGWNFHPW